MTNFVEHNWPPKDFTKIERIEPHYLGSPEAELRVAKALRWLMVRFADGKVSHRFDGLNIPKKPEYEGLVILKDSSALHVRNRLDDIRMSLGGWQKGATVEPNSDEIDPEQIADGFLYGWNDGIFVNDYDKSGDPQIRVQRIILRGKFRLLRGYNDFRIYGVNVRDRSEVPLRIIEWFDRRNQSLYTKYPLL